MKRTLLFSAILLLCGTICSNCSENKFVPAVDNALRAPAYPLVTVDPYTCVWSFGDTLNDESTKHWTGKPHPLIGALRVDGEIYRFMGVEELSLKQIIPTAGVERWNAQYTERTPRGNWTAVDYADNNWNSGKAAFGTREQNNLSTLWTSKEIWVRRTFELPDDIVGEDIYLNYSHDDTFELFINGINVVSTGYEWRNNVIIQLNDEVKATLKKGKNVIAAHCKNKTGGAYVDFGLFSRMPNAEFFANKAEQLSVTVSPTSTYYKFVCGGVDLNIVFTAPLLMDNLDLISRPVNYLSYNVASRDGKKHDVQLYVEMSPLWAVHDEFQSVNLKKEEHDGIEYLSAGTVLQDILRRKGDNVRIDWGYAYLASRGQKRVTTALGNYVDLKREFATTGMIQSCADSQQAVSPTETAMAYCADLGYVKTDVSDKIMLGYDDIYSIQYFKDNRKAYWKHDDKVTIYDAFAAADRDYASLMKKCQAFDKRMFADACKAGGRKYAEICALAYRQSIAAHKLVLDKEGEMLFLSKENFSNGSIGTVDITYPSSPLYLLYNPDLLKGMLNPIFHFCGSDAWTKPFAAHDVGSYPRANGQTYGGDMPVEESGNMLILATAISVREGNTEYAGKHWALLTEWADYLLKEGLDPANQLCTDDFAGHFAHNTNLSIKAILGVAGYGKMAGMLGDKAMGDKYINAAKEMASKWMQMAFDGDHYRLTFDKENTWSQKYNLIWDRLLGLNVFPTELAKTEMAYYRTHQNQYGLPLDIRRKYTKSDWIMWSACLTGDEADFESLVSPLYDYVNQTPSRIPLSDWHDTVDAHSVGFRARSVVGGYFMKMLIEQM